MKGKQQNVSSMVNQVILGRITKTLSGNVPIGTKTTIQAIISIKCTRIRHHHCGQTEKKGWSHQNQGIKVIKIFREKLSCLGEGRIIASCTLSGRIIEHQSLYTCPMRVCILNHCFKFIFICVIIREKYGLGGVNIIKDLSIFYRVDFYWSTTYLISGVFTCHLRDLLVVL